MSTDTNFSTLLRELFQGDRRRMSAQLQPLTAEQRRALFGEFRDLLKVLKRACRFQADAKGVGLSELYRAIQDDPAAFLRERAATLAAPGALNNTEWMRQLFYSQLMEFYSRLQLLQAGLASKGGVVDVFRHSERYPVWPPQFFLRAGQVLLDRPEPWAQDALIQVFTDLEARLRFVGGGQGIAALMRIARQRHPDWAAGLAPYLGRAMRQDGFLNRKLDGYDAEMILAGLEYEPPAGDVASFEPLMDPTIVDAIFADMAKGRLRRSDVVALTLRKLQGPLRPGLAKMWIEFQQRLALTDTEMREQLDAFISLLNAPAPAVSKLALATVEQYALNDADRAAELSDALGYLLRHPVQALAQAALRLLKKLLKLYPALTGSVLNAAMAGLGSPHAALRSQLLRWIGALPLSHFDAETLERLRDAALALPVGEQRLIVHLVGGREEAPIIPDAASSDVQTGLWEHVAGLKQRSGNELWRRRLAVLEGYLATGECPLLEPMAADQASAQGPADFARHETPEALATDLTQTQRRIFSLADYERICDGILRFATSAESERVRAILTPLLNRIDDWRQVSNDGAGFGKGGELTGLVLAHAWQTGRLPELPKGSRGEPVFNFQFSLAWQRRLKHVLALRAAGHDGLLSVPTHAAGWLTPMVFAERLACLPRPLLDPDELGAALYRLPNRPDLRAPAWSRLAEWVESGNDVLDQAVALALAPDERAMSALAWFMARFAQHPPTERLFQMTHFGESLVETFRAKVLHQTPDTPENTAFRLFHAALRCRFGLGDAGISNPALLAERLAPRASWLTRLFQQSGTEASPFADLLFAPRPVTEALAHAAHTAVSGLRYVQDTPYPFLWPYLLAHPHQFVIASRVDNLVYQFPPLAQRLFEAGQCRLGRKDDYNRELTLNLLAQGRLPQVEVSADWRQTARGLALPHAALREGCVDVLAQWLNDGRLIPVDGAAVLADLIRETGQGFGHLEQALASLSATGRLGQATVLLALEQALAGNIAEFPGRKLSLMLDRWAAILDDTRRGVENPAVRGVLETLAAGKKSVARDKASALLTRPCRANPSPIWLEALALTMAEAPR